MKILFDQINQINNRTIRAIFPSYKNYFEELVKIHYWLVQYLEITEKMFQSTLFWIALSLTLTALNITPYIFSLLWTTFMILPLNLLNLLNYFLIEEKEKGAALPGFHPKKAGWDALGKRLMVGTISVTLGMTYRHYLTENRKLMAVIAQEKRKIWDSTNISPEIKEKACASIDKTAEHGSLLGLIKDALSL